MNTGTLAVGFIDYSDLVCCGHKMEPSVVYIGKTHPGTKGFGCLGCGNFVTQMAFLQNSHGTQADRRRRIASGELSVTAVQRAAA